MKIVDVKSSPYIDFDKKKITKKILKFKIIDHLRISKHKNIFTKVCIPNWSEEVIVITKVKNAVLWTYVISDLKVKNLLERFMKKKKVKRNLR